MPDLIHVFSQRSRSIIALTLVATVIALIAASLSPKKYLSVATALPTNSLTADKARMFNSNIEILYSDFGTPDELDKLEGTAVLDTIFLAVAKEFDLAPHYKIERSGEDLYKAAMELKKNSKISRSGYGELKVKVWDEDRNMAASMANSLMQKIQELHQTMQNATSVAILQQIRADQVEKESLFRAMSDSYNGTSADAELARVKKNALLDQIQQNEKMIDQYELAIRTHVPVLLNVEYARASLWPDKPKVWLTVAITFMAALIFSFLMALFFESRKKRA